MKTVISSIALLAVVLAGVACSRRVADQDTSKGSAVISGPDRESIEATQAPMRDVQFEPSVIVAHSNAPAPLNRPL